ncbi:FHIPEP family type III secretion protein [[Micrococcus luteus] ATCC 49442]|uniref:FHIPEP family type III secretion protein n=1 Tax=[Micrococcus luteus] ATCC 49442 TaxID=2698727 RepID=UPI0013DBB89E|nr:FHIPEP family type III secretion protein [[Micrococcus luteus] ATCC 49442]
MTDQQQLIGPRVEGFPRDEFLELLRLVRTTLITTERQEDLLHELRVPANLVLGETGIVGPAYHSVTERPNRTALTVPALPPRADDQHVDLQIQGDRALPGDYLEGQQPVPSRGKDAALSRAAEMVAPTAPPGRSTNVRRFAERLLDAVATPEHLDAAVVLARRARSQLPLADQDHYDWLVSRLEDVQADTRRRSLAQGQFPDLDVLSDWAGFECLHYYSLTDRFVGRGDYLARLDRWIEDREAAPVMCLTALGGAGKSALAWHWVDSVLTRLRQAGFRGALWCSFYEGTFQFEAFLRRALTFCGRMSPDRVDALDRSEVEKHLLDALANDRYLVIIDGFERLMAGYAQTAERAVDDEGTRGTPDREGATTADRRMTDQRDGAFLTRLAAPLASRLLITTRMMPAELEAGDNRQPRPHVVHVDLPGLGPDDAIGLWVDLAGEPSVEEEEEILDVLTACGFHPLAISILARSVAAAGSWSSWLRAEGHHDFDPSGPPARARATVIGTCVSDLSTEAEELLSYLAVSGKPMSVDEITHALRQQSILQGEERWTEDGRVQRELQDLLNRGFVGRAVVDGITEYDEHPVVRGLMWARLTDTRRTPDRARFLDQAMSELTAVPDPQLASGSVNLDKAASIFQVLVSTGQIDRAWEMFSYKLWTALYTRAAYRELLNLFEQLLPGGDPLQLLPLQSPKEQADAAQMLANLMMSSDDAEIADRLLIWSGVLRLRMRDMVAFLEVRRDQTWNSLYRGALFETELALRRIKVQALAMGVDGLFSTVNPWIGLVLALRDRSSAAQTYLVVDEKDEINRRWWTQGVAEGYVYLGEAAKAIQLLDHLEDDVGIEPAQQSWELLTRGMAEGQQGGFEAADNHLRAALVIARRANYRIVQCFALVALGDLAVSQGRWAEAGERADEYFEIDPTGYQLTAGDAWRIRALCAEQAGSRDRALEYAAAAYQACACDGPPFMYAVGARRAREVLERLGGYVPRTTSRLLPTWQEELAKVGVEEAALKAQRARFGRRIAIIEQRAHNPERRRRMRNLVHLATEEDRRWWALVAGDRSALTAPLAGRMVNLGLSVADLRKLFELSTEKSLEVVFFRLDAARVIEPDTPTPYHLASAEQRAAWLEQVDVHETALDEFLRSERAAATAEPFRYQGLDARGVDAFSRDARRRIQVDAAPPEARQWWNQLQQRRGYWDMLVLAECIASAPATLQEFVEAISLTGTRSLEYAFMSLREKRAIARLEVTSVSRTEGWTPLDVLLRLQTVKYQLGWLELEDDVREFWRVIEDRYSNQPELVLQLAEQLAMRGSSIAQYHDASLRSSDPEDSRATIAYLDYLRLNEAQWPEVTWPDDVSVRRWSYDSASPSFRDVGSWTREQIDRWLDTAREGIGYALAPDRARRWWDALESQVAPATMVRLSEELQARGATVGEFYRAHVDADSDNLVAVLAFLDFTRVADRHLSPDEGVQADRHLGRGHGFYENDEFGNAAEEYELALAADPQTEAAYLYLALSYEKLDPDDSSALRRPVSVLQRGVEHCPHSTDLRLELERFALSLPPYQPLDRRRVVVELSDPKAVDINYLLSGAEDVRADVAAIVGVPIAGLRFREAYLSESSYRILLDEVQVAEGTFIPGHRFFPGHPDGQDAPWPRPGDRPPGEWLPAEQTTDPDGGPAGLSPEEYLLNDIRRALPSLSSSLLTDQIVLTLLDDGWTQVDAANDLALLTSFTRVLQGLLDDEVPIGHIDMLLEEFAPLHRDGVSESDALSRLRRLADIAPLLPGSRRGDVKVRLDPQVEHQLAETAAHGPDDVLLVAPDVLHRMLDTIRSALTASSDHPGRPVLVVGSRSIRRPVRLLVRPEFPGLPVVAEDELNDSRMQP